MGFAIGGVWWMKEVGDAGCPRQGVFCGQEEVGALAVHVMGVFGGHVPIGIIINNTASIVL